VRSFNIGINELVHRAVDLDAEFQKQRAQFYAQSWDVSIHQGGKNFFWLPRYEPFDAKTMENVKEGVEIEGNSAISLVISPALVKAGNADGEAYGVDKVLMKAVVAAETYFQGSEEGSGPSPEREVKERDPGAFDSTLPNRAPKRMSSLRRRIF